MVLVCTYFFKFIFNLDFTPWSTPLQVYYTVEPPPHKDQQGHLFLPYHMHFLKNVDILGHFLFLHWKGPTVYVHTNTQPHLTHSHSKRTHIHTPHTQHSTAQHTQYIVHTQHPALEIDPWWSRWSRREEVSRRTTLMMMMMMRRRRAWV